MNALRQAAQAVVDRFDEPDDADLPGIATFVRRLRTALAAPEQEPVAYFNMAINETVGCIAYEYEKHALKSGEPLYAAPVDIEALTKDRNALEEKVYKLELENKGIVEWWGEYALTKANRDIAPVDVVTLTKERDEYQQAADTQAMDHKVERDALAKTLDAIENKVDALIVERDALAEDAARYRWLRRSATRLSFDNSLIGSLVRDQAELDGAIKETGVQ